MEKKIDKHIEAAKSYINTHPDTTGTVNAMVALTMSIQQFNQTSSTLSNRLVWWTGILAFATAALVIVNLF